MKYEYKTVPIKTEKDMERAEKLHKAGWKHTVTGIHKLQFYRPIKKVKQYKRNPNLKRSYTDERGNTITVVTDNKWKEIIYFEDLPKRWQREYDWAGEGSMFFKFRNYYYALGNFMAFRPAITDKRDPMYGWDGYAGDSYFSGMLVKFDNSGEAVKVATYYS